MNNIRSLITLLALVIVAVPVFGQGTDGNITGAAMDATGAVIPGTRVELENSATGIVRTAECDATGTYRFNNVPVGAYKLTARAEGFTAATLENVAVNLNRTSTVNLVLEVGAVATQIEISEAASSLDTTTATIGSSFKSVEAIYNPASTLPLGVYNLALMSAGVASSGGVGLGEGPSVGGQRPRQNNFMVEGIDNNRKEVTGSNIRGTQRSRSGVFRASESIHSGIWTFHWRPVQCSSQERDQRDSRYSLLDLRESETQCC